MRLARPHDANGAVEMTGDVEMSSGGAAGEDAKQYEDGEWRVDCTPYAPCICTFHVGCKVYLCYSMDGKPGQL